MNILLTNDDGYEARGIKLLKEKLQKYGQVTVVAPRDFMSAKSCSLTIRDGLEFKKREARVFSLSGFPADCVAFALSSLNTDFDLVVSGCNHGLNISYDTLYSGTIGACLEAVLHHKKSIAFSCAMNFEVVEEHFDEVMDFIEKKGLLSTDYFLNVNFPVSSDVQAVKLSKLYFRRDRNFYTKDENGLFWAQRELENEIADPETDCYMVAHNTVSITPISGSFFDLNLYKNLAKK